MRNRITRSSRMRAFEALAALLARSSAIRVDDFDLEAIDSGREIDILVHIDVLGSSYTLACQVAASEELHSLRRALERLRIGISKLPGRVTPILVAPCLSPEAQVLCRESNTGFVDLEGNGCVGFGEVFISARALPCRDVHQSAAPHAKRAGGGIGGKALEGFSPIHASGWAGCGGEGSLLPCGFAGGRAGG